jgi:glucose-6-phosphate 1-dehydrogenase
MTTTTATRNQPFVEDQKDEDETPPVALVIFGATGDLTRRKLIPAIYNLAADGLLGPSFAVVGLARREQSTEHFRTELEAAVREHSRRPVDPAIWQQVAEHLHYVQGEFSDHAAYQKLGRQLHEVDQLHHLPGHRVFYLAAPPATYPEILRELRESGLAKPSGSGAFTRIVIEKPIGHDLQSSRALNQALLAAFDESQIYRIDHYLGKETVQNILVFRLGNGIFEPLWNRRYIEHVQITVAETLGVEGRGAYFDSAGVSRDILQNHLLQLLTLTAMEPPVRFTADAVRDEKVKVLRSLKPLDHRAVAEQSVRAQYQAGTVAGEPVPGYREEPAVAPRSMTETFLALKLEIDNWRWAGVPFYLRVGKRLPKRATEIAISFRRPPISIFRDAGCGTIESNVLSLRIQPDEGISLSFGSKAPGQAIHIDPVQMDFLYETSFGWTPPEAYEHLILDCMQGDSTLFARKDEVELAWELVDSIQSAWQRGKPPLVEYEAGTWGPAAADQLIGRDGFRWRRLG